MKKLHVRKGGFTLIELMIVVAIIGILAAIAIPNFLRFQLKAKSSEGKTNLAAIRTAEQSYYSEFGVYVSADVSPTGAANRESAFIQSYRAEWTYFLAVIRGEVNAPPPKDQLLLHSVVEAVYRSADEGRDLLL